MNEFQKERNMLLMRGYIRLNIDIILAPKLVLHKIMEFFNHENIIPCNIFDWKKQLSYQNFTNVYVNGSSFFYVNDGNISCVDVRARKRLTHEGTLGANTKNVEHYFHDEIPSIISHGIKNFHCFIYTINDELHGFGDNFLKQISKDADNGFLEPMLIKYNFDSRIIQIECGFEHTLFLTLNGNVYGSGNNASNQLTSNHSRDNTYGISKIYDKRDIIRIGCVYNSSYVLTKNNILLSVGSNSFGQLGRTTKVTTDKDKLIQIDGNIPVQTFNCGSFHVGCLTTKSTINMFGYNKYGELGLNITDKKYGIPTHLMIDNLNDKIIDVQCGDHHTIIKTLNNYYSFGDNNHLQLLIESSLKLVRKPILLDVLYIKSQTGFDGDIIDIMPAFRTSLVFQKL